MPPIRSTLCAFAFLITMGGSAFAGNIDYTLTAGTDVISFSLPELPAVQSSCNFFSDASCFAVYPVSLTVDGSGFTGNVSFFQPGVGGGLTVCTGTVCAAGTVLVNNNGPGGEQLFTGTLADPTLEEFSDLQLIEAGAGSPQYDKAFTLNATSSSTAPEPGSCLLLMLGLGAGMLMARSRGARSAGRSRTHVL